MKEKISEYGKRIGKIALVAAAILILQSFVFSFGTNKSDLPSENVLPEKQQESSEKQPEEKAADSDNSNGQVIDVVPDDKADAVDEKSDKTGTKENSETESVDEKNKEDEEADTKQEEEILEPEDVEDKEAVVEENTKREYPKWQSSTNKQVRDRDYLIKVNKQTNTVTVYIKEEDGSLTPFKAMVCSVGRQGHSTPEGKGYHTSEYYDWRLMVDNTYGRYAVRFNGSIMFHSVPYYKSRKDSLEWEDYNKLGSPASLGCVRLAVADAKWIFDNCRRGTEVEVYSGPADTDPLGTPDAIRLDTNSEYRDWDPTDLTPENPWLKPVE